MSVESASGFLKELESNAGLRSKALPHFDFENNQWDAAGVIGVAAKEGYNFTVDDLEAAAQDVYGGELSEEQLDLIAGGGCCSCAASCCCC